MNHENTGLQLIYDDECPVCQHYVRGIRLHQAAGQLTLIDARSGHPLVQHALQSGYRLNQGMLLVIGSNYFFGADAIHMLTLLSSPSHFSNRLLYKLFRNQTAAQYVYPILRTGRNLLLRLLGRSAIDDRPHRPPAQK